MFRFEITHQSTKSRARTGLIHTPHGVLETPAFIFCATKAALKGVSTAQLRELGASVILSNTYHLMLQPGADVVAKMGGLHTFMDWQGPMLTDSGGFQVFSLGHGNVADEIKGRGVPRKKQLLDISEEGARFQSYRDGAYHLLTPERSMEIQQKLGADLVVSFDECTPYHVPRSYTEKSMRLSARWGKRCLVAFDPDQEGRQALYSVVQGGTYPDLRTESAAASNTQPFFGQAIGGSLGAESAQMYDVVAHTMTQLDAKRPTHLLGIGKVADIKAQVAFGIDTFDCVHPTRMARHGGALITSTEEGRAQLNIKNACFREDSEPLDETCPCSTCRAYTKGYLHHLFKAGEMLGPIALTVHNISFMVRLMSEVRAAIRQNRL